MSLHLETSSPTLLLILASLSQPRFAAWAYEQAGVACVIITRVVVTIPVDIPAFSASVRMETALLCSVNEEQLNRVTPESTAMTPKEIFQNMEEMKILVRIRRF